MFEKIVSLNSLYFSTDFNLTLNIQRIIQKKLEREMKRNQPLHSTTDFRFFFNAHYCEFLLKNKMSELVIPVIQGYLEVNTSFEAIQ